MAKPRQDRRKPPRRGHKPSRHSGELPPVGVADVVERDGDGDLYVRLAKAGEDAPMVRLAPTRSTTSATPTGGNSPE